MFGRKRKAPSGVRLDSRGTLSEKLAFYADKYGDEWAEEVVDEQPEAAMLTSEQRAEAVRAGREALRRQWGA